MMKTNVMNQVAGYFFDGATASEIGISDWCWLIGIPLLWLMMFLAVVS